MSASEAGAKTLCLRSGQQVFVIDQGPVHAPAFITLHGVPGSVIDFQYIAKALGDSVRLIRLDLPGFGGSRRGAYTACSPEERARVVLELADALGLKRFGILSHSLGGSVALAAGALAPERVSFLVFLASVGLRPHRALPGPPWVLRLAGPLWRLAPLRKRLTASFDTAYRRLRFPGVEAFEARDYAWHMRVIGALSFRRLRRHAAAIKASCLVAWAVDDPLIEDAIGRELARALDAEFVCYPRGGHGIPKHQAEDIARRVLALVG